jgi:hypothetical protein
MADIENRTFTAAVRSMLGTTGRERANAVRALVAELMQADVVGRWAGDFARRNNFYDRDMYPDLEQVMWEKIVATLNTATPENTDRVDDWVRFLHGISRNTASKWLASGQVTVAQGMSGVERRRAVIARTRAKLLQTLNREPTVQEIIDHANQASHEHYRDATQQGVLLKPEHFEYPGAVSLEALVRDPSVSDETDRADGEMEASTLLKTLQNLAGRMFPGDDALHQVLNAWAKCVLERERPTTALIAEETGLAEGVVRPTLRKVNAVMSMFRETVHIPPTR